MDIEQTRFNMIEQQIRPWGVSDPALLTLLTVVKREQFVPEYVRALAFADTELPLPDGQNMLPPKTEARLVQALALAPHEHVLQIGTGSGHVAALLAHCAAQVISVEISPVLLRFAHANLARSGIHNVELVQGNAAQGWPGQYDAICLCASLPVIPRTLLDQLKIGGRLVVFIGEAPVMQAHCITRRTQHNYTTLSLFETLVTPLMLATQPSHFIF